MDFPGTQVQVFLFSGFIALVKDVDGTFEHLSFPVGNHGRMDTESAGDLVVLNGS